MATRRSLQETFYPETSFGGFPRSDGTMAFYQRVNALLKPSDVVLDVGCGRGEYAEDSVESRAKLRTLRGKCAAVIGVDSDVDAAANPCVDEFRHILGDRWPVEREAIDLCLVDSVLEHVDDPDAFFGECRRVLRPEGYLCVRTPNALGYATVMARLIPNAAHAAVLARVQTGRRAVDIFPTFYRCNSSRRLRDALRRHGFEACVYGYGPAPAYLDFSTVAYTLGVIWAAAAPSVVQAELHGFARRGTWPGVERQKSPAIESHSGLRRVLEIPSCPPSDTAHAPRLPLKRRP